MKPTKAPPAALHTNPTSTGTTVGCYAILIYLAAEHLLHNNPRHVQYRESLRQAQKASPVTPPCPPSSRDHFPLPKDTTQGITSKGNHQPYRPPSPHPRSNRSSPYPPYRSARTIPIYQETQTPTGLSKAQMSDAWVRMRAVTRSRVEPVTIINSSMKGTKAKDKVRRHVQWAQSVQSYPYEHQFATDDEETKIEQNRQAEGTKVGENQGQREDDRVVVRELEIWAPAETGGEHEIWGNTADNTF